MSAFVYILNCIIGGIIMIKTNSVILITEHMNNIAARHALFVFLFSMIAITFAALIVRVLRR